MLVQTVVLSVALVATLIILFACIGDNIILKMEVDKLKRQSEIQRLEYSDVYQNYVRLLMKPAPLNPITPDIKEAVHYAMIKAHPDNEGNQEDFIKFRKLYERINNESK